MFRNLKLRLTLTNVIVVGLIFIITIASIYFLMANNISRQSIQFMQLIASDSGAKAPNIMPRKHRHLIDYFYVKINQENRLFDASPNIIINKSQMLPLINTVIQTPEDEGKAAWYDDQTYRFLKLPLVNNQGSILVFVNTESEDELMEKLFSALTVAGITGLFLAFFGGLFMADRALIPIKASWERQKNFVADASHELRTPLAVMQTNLELIMDNKEETVANQYKWLENIQAENKLMAKLVDDLLFLARADSHQVLLEKKKFSLNSALQNAIRPFEPLANKKNLDLEVLVDSQVSFYGDETRLKQLAVILIDNAIKYTSKGGKISLKLNKIDNGVEILVSDTGKGIEQEHLPKVFERFYRVDKARSRQNGSHGLGLSIAEWIVKEHNGTIKVTSSPEEGTSFLITLPCDYSF